MEAEGVEYAAEGFPDVGVGEGFVGQGAGAGDFDGDVVQFGEGEDVGQVGEGLRGRRGFEGLGEAHMVNDYLGVGVAAGQFAEQGELAGAHYVDGDAGPGAGGEDAVEARVVGRVFLGG